MNNWKRLAITLTNLLIAAMLVNGAQAAGVQRTSYIVSNLTCTSCLATIEAELKGLPGTIGMNADLQQGRVVVDHQPELDYEKIASAITNVGYPAKVDWTATVPDQNVTRYPQRSKYSSGCNSGGCGNSGRAGAGPTAWKTPPAAGTISRTTLQVSNLSCTSCLNNIAVELSKLSDTYGMNGYLSRGTVLVDHTDALESSRIAAIISGLGYPARVMATNEIPAQKAFAAAPNNGSAKPGVRSSRSGRGCNSKSPCNATSASWKKLYNRYFTQQTNSKSPTID